MCSQPSRIVSAVRLRQVPIADHHVRAARQDLAVVGDLHFDAGDRLADRAECDALSSVPVVMTGDVSVSP